MLPLEVTRMLEKRDASYVFLRKLGVSGAPLRLYELARVLLHREEIIISFCISSDLARKQLANSSREVSLSLNFVIRALVYT